MGLESELRARADAKCELCGAADDLRVFAIRPFPGSAAAPTPESAVLICGACATRMDAGAAADEKTWYCLATSMWSEHRPVQVLTYRILKALGANPWSQDLLGQLYLDDETRLWADALGGDTEEKSAPTVDSNGTPLADGDSVTLIKDLEVKGGGFTAKRGTLVKGISLTDDTKYVEGRVNGIRIVLVAAYLKKA